MNKKLTFMMVVLAILLSSFAYADLKTDNQMWVSLQDGNESDFDVYGGVTGAEGQTNGTFEFDGVGGYVAIPTFSRPTSKFVLKANIKTDDSSGIMIAIGGDDGNAGPQQESWVLGLNAGNVYGYTRTSVGVLTAVQGSTNLSDNAWHEIKLVYDGSTLKVYADEVLEDTHNSPSTPGSGTGFAIGSQSDSKFQSYFDGKIDEVEIFSNDLETTRVFYASFNSLYDQTNNSNSLSGYDGVTYDSTTNSYDFDGTDDYLKNNYNLDYTSSSYSLWIKTTDTISDPYILSNRMSSGNYQGLYTFIDSDGTYVISLGTSTGNPEISDASIDIADNSWHNLIVTLDGSQMSLFIDGIQDGSNISYTGTVSTTSGIYLGSASSPSHYFDGSISGVAIYDRTLSPSEISTLYSNGRDYTPYNGTPSNTTIVARDTITLTYLQTFNATVNGTYYNTTSGLITLPYLQNESYIVNITVEADNYDTGTYLNHPVSSNLVADLNISLISVAIVGREVVTNQTVTDFVINSTYYNAVTTNGTINIGLPKDINTFNITNDLGYYNKTNYEFNISQLQYTYYVYFNDVQLNITAKDMVTNSSITSFDIDLLYTGNGTYDTSESTTTSNIFYNNLIAGTYNATIDAAGFELQTVELNLTGLSESYEFEVYTTNSVNITFKDEETNSVITAPITVEFISDTVSYNYTTSTGNLYVDLLAPESYNIRYASENYTTRYYYFELSNRTHNDLTLYLLEDQQTDLLTVTVIDQEATSLEGALVKSLKYDIGSNSYILQQSLATDSNGEVVFSVRLGEEFYYFIVEYPAGTQLKQTSPSLIYSSTVLIQVQTQASGGTSWQNTLGVNHNITWYNDTNEFTFRYNDLEGTVSSGCLYIYDSRYSGQTLLNSSCSNGASNTITLGVEGNEGDYYIAKGYVKVNGAYTLMEELQKVIPIAGIYNYTSLFLVGILILTFALTAIKTGPAAVVLLPMVGLSAVKLMGLIATEITWGAVLSLWAVSIIITIILKKRSGI